MQANLISNIARVYMPTHFQTADLCDAHPGVVRVAQPIFKHFGAHKRFHGPIATIKVFEDNVAVKDLLGTPGHGRVLVVDGAGSLNSALVGDVLAKIAIDNGWSGIIVNSCIRDSATIDTMPIGIRALATNPRRCNKAGGGTRDCTLEFASVKFVPGEYLYADEDGIVVSVRSLL